MATTTSSNVVSLPAYKEAVRTALDKADSFSGSQMSAYRFLVPTLSNGEARIGQTVRIPHWNMVGKFEDVNDGVALTPRAMGNDYTEATVSRSGLAMEYTRLAGQVFAGKSIPQEFARQFVMRFNQHIDLKCQTAALSATGLPGDQVINRYSSTTPQYLDYDGLIALKSTIGDRQWERYGLMLHSKSYAMLLRQKDSTGRPNAQIDSINALFNNRLDWIISDRMQVSDGVFTVSSSGTTPPAVTLTGTPNRLINFRMECTTLGARGTAIVRTSINGGVTWKSSITTAATFTLVDPDDDDASTGVTVNYANASAAVDNVWTATATSKAANVLIAPNALAYYYDASAMSLEDYRQPLNDKNALISNVYHAEARFLNDYNNQRRPDVSILYTNIPSVLT